MHLNHLPFATLTIFASTTEWFALRLSCCFTLQRCFMNSVLVLHFYRVQLMTERDRERRKGEQSKSKFINYFLWFKTAGQDRHNFSVPAEDHMLPEFLSHILHVSKASNTSYIWMRNVWLNTHTHTQTHASLTKTMPSQDKLNIKTNNFT